MWLGAGTCFTLQAEFQGILKDYVGRETPLYYAERLSKHYAKSVGCKALWSCGDAMLGISSCCQKL